MARMIFKKAVRWKLIAENPFEDVAAGSTANDARSFFVTREMADKVVEACPDAQWKLLFALSRYGGLRCPSEHLRLKWSDVDWEHNRITVHSPKMECHEGKESRLIPLFPELRAPLMEVFEEAEPGNGVGYHAIPEHKREPAHALQPDNQKGWAVALAAIVPQPAPTRQTELTEEYPVQVVCAWVGNTEKVARKHYLQITDAHFAKAVRAQQSATQTTADKAGLTGTSDKVEAGKTLECPAKAELVHAGPEEGIAATGLEPVTRGL